MPYTFGAATSDRITVALATGIAGGRAGLVCGWFYPTTLTAGRGLWNAGNATGVEIDTTTTQLRLKSAHSTTVGQWTTSDAGLAINKWSFIAALNVLTGGGGGAWRAWAGAIDTPPAELTVTSAVAAAGNANQSSNFVLGNLTANNVAFQGDIAEGSVLVSAQSAPPFFLAGNSAVTDAEALFIYQRAVLPQWLGGMSKLALDGIGSGVMAAGRIVLDTLPVWQYRQQVNTTTLPPLAPTITGATVSQNGHPRPPVSSQLFAHNRRR